jgi:hypothetical protein
VFECCNWREIYRIDFSADLYFSLHATPTAEMLPMPDTPRTPVSAAAGGDKEEALPTADERVGQLRASDSVPFVAISHSQGPDPGMWLSIWN